MAKMTLAEKLAAQKAGVKSARKKADAKADPQLVAIQKHADKLAEIFSGLKLTDKATYDALIKVVNEATRQNEAIGSVIKRLKALGKASVKLATSIGNIPSGGALAALSSALKKAKRA